MPAPIPPRPHTEILANGLRVTLRHVPGLKRSAAALRVAAGSHDVPLAWPGLAHFLEHLLFLGTERFPTDEALMAYVQRHGGQVNASTRERTTDFFFELPPSTFGEGLERLSDMLAKPRMNLGDQLREREVLHAEFIAWSQDPTAQQQFALYEGLPAQHPLRGFHAGNRDSLKVEAPAFQQALKSFHRQFYQTGQMTLSLVGPQSLQALKEMAEQFAAALPVGDNVAQAMPLPLAVKSYQQVGERCSNLVFAFDSLPEAADEALAFLCHWLNSGKSGGLLHYLQQQKLANGLKAAPVYHFAGQALLHLEFAARGESLQSIHAHVLDWLSFFAQQDWAPLRVEYAALHQRQQQVSAALPLAQRDAGTLENGLSDAGVEALNRILVEIGTVDNFTGPWQLPAANPFLRPSEPLANAGLIRGQTSAHRGLRTFAQDRSRGRRERSPMHFSQALSNIGDDGAIYLRWQVEAAASAALLGQLQRSLRLTAQDAREAGVELTFTATANQWLLKLTGLQEPMPIVLEHALKCLTHVDADSPHDEPETPLIPIRQLLKALPEHILRSSHTSDDLEQLWTTSRWDGLAVGLSAQSQSALGLALSRIPGVPDNQLPAPTTISADKHWNHIDTASSEHAVLLFCPSPERDIDGEAAWRMLAQLCQTPFYQRLRGELQLGYAVFSALRQIQGRTALLFGVQSPSASPAEILMHIQQFLEGIPALVAQLDDEKLSHHRQNLADQFDASTLAGNEAAELLWQAKLAGHSSDYLDQIIAAIHRLDRTTLLAAAQGLLNAEGGWLCLASEPAPDAPWQANN